MTVFLRALWLPTLVVLVTAFWIWLDGVMGWRGLHAPRLGSLLVLAGVLLAAWCGGLFAHLGKGSPHPFIAKTKHLVIVGPYRYVRNPMMWGVGTILVGLALGLGSVGLWLGLGMFIAFVLLFVRFYEEPDLEQRFGEEYRAYCRKVPRWLPRLTGRHRT